MFVVRSYSPFDMKWKERDKEIIATVGPTNFSGAGVARIHHWLAKTYGEAEELRRKLEAVPDVSVTVTRREDVVATAGMSAL
jgi:hypothetical protein